MLDLVNLLEHLLNYLKHFGNYLVKVVAEWQFKFNEKIKNQQTYVDTEIKVDE